MIQDLNTFLQPQPEPTSLEALINQLTEDNHNLRTTLCLYGKLVDENRELKIENEALKQERDRLTTNFSNFEQFKKQAAERLFLLVENQKLEVELKRVKEGVK